MWPRKSSSHPDSQESLHHPQKSNELAEVTFDFKPSNDKEGSRASSSNNFHSNKHLITLLALTFWLNVLLYGVLPSLQSYTCLPYGHLAYSLTVQLTVLINPLSCFVALFFSVKHLGWLVMLITLGTLLSAYQVTLAAMSPYPPLYDQTAGVVIMVCILDL